MLPYLTHKMHRSKCRSATVCVVVFFCVIVLLNPLRVDAGVPQDSLFALPVAAGTVSGPSGDVVVTARSEGQQAATVQETVSPVEENTVSTGDASKASRKGPSQSGKPKLLHLFGYVEFRSVIKNMPKWERVLTVEEKSSSFDPRRLDEALTPDVAARWKKIAAKSRDLALPEKLKIVNNFFNQWPYKTDIINWGVEDHWATPKEFVRKSGDCEDYAIAKYYALRSLGVPTEQLRIVAVIEKIRRIGHAVLVVFMDDNAYVLDNVTNLILPHTRLLNYEPKFSVNENFRWAHIKPVAQPKK